MSKNVILASCILSAFASGCADPETSSPKVSATSFETTDAWLGRWNGPEGTYLRIESGGGRYKVTIQDLDAARTFEGRSTAGQIVFERDGVKESIRATAGPDTGMKWLADKANCLTIRPGEGYCRD